MITFVQLCICHATSRLLPAQSIEVFLVVFIIRYVSLFVFVSPQPTLLNKIYQQ